jgi:ABC-2 type transport system ATP-binding protein
MIIEVSNLVKRYGDLIAVDNLSLNVEKGEIFGLLGPNGSGKTTTINCILSLLKFDRGSICVFGKEMSPKAYDIKKDIGIVMQNVAVFDELTVRENINYFCGLYIKDKKECKKLVDEAIEFTNLSDFEKFYPKKLSGGLLRRLNIACGIAHKPKLIILDEPTVAVDPQSRNNILEGIKELNKKGATILYTSHYMEEIEQLCTKIAIMDKGKIIAMGTSEELKNMIGNCEKIRVEILGEDIPRVEELSKELKTIGNIKSSKSSENYLYISSEKGMHVLANVLYYLQEKNVTVGNVYSEEPTLNDVFLEITGKELRDNV